jgi:hypothetical protein
MKSTGFSEWKYTGTLLFMHSFALIYQPNQFGLMCGRAAKGSAPRLSQNLKTQAVQ